MSSYSLDCLFSKQWILFLSILLVGNSAIAADRYWVAATAANWNNTANWSATSGGTGGSSVPGVVDGVFFDALGLGNCQLDGNTTITAIRINSGYTGAVDLNNFTLSVQGNFDAILLSADINNGTFSVSTSANTVLSGSTFGAVANINSAGLSIDNSTFNNLVILEKTGGNASWSGNVFNSTATIINSGFGSLFLGNTAPDAFNGDVTFTNTSLGGVFVNWGGFNTHLAGNVQVNSTNGSGVSLGANVGNSITLATGKTVTVGSLGITKGTLWLTRFVQQGSTPQQIHLPVGTNTSLRIGPTSVFNGNVDFKANSLIINETTFNGTALLEKSGTFISWSGNVFNSTAHIINSGFNYLRLGDPLPTQYNDDVIFTNTGANQLIVNFGGSNSHFVGNVQVNSTNGVGVVIAGGPGNNITLADGKTITPGSLGITAGSLRLIRFEQLGGTSQVIHLPLGTNTSLKLHTSIFNGNVDFKADSLTINETTFNGTALLEKTGAFKSWSGNVFNSTATIINSGGGYLRLGDPLPDHYNDDVNFIKTNIGPFSPAYVQASVFKGNISTVGSTTSISFGSGGGAVLLDGSTVQRIQGDAGFAPVIHTLTINNPAGVVLDVPLTVATNLAFTAGNITSNTANPLTIGNGATVSGASSSRFVDGPVKKLGNQAFTFPIGKNGNYQTISISAPSLSTDGFTAEYFDSEQAFGAALDTGLGGISSCEYWQLDRSGGASNIDVTLGWNTNSCDITQPADMRVSNWDGSKWVNIGNGSTTGDPSNGTVVSASSVSAFGAFALGNIATTLLTVDDIDLGIAADFALLAGGDIDADAVTNANGSLGAVGAISTNIIASDGTFPFNPANVQEALSDLSIAIDIIQDIPGVPLSSNLGGQTLAKGVYDLTGNVKLNGVLTLSGNPFSIYVFRIADSLTVDSAAQLRLGNVQPQNVFWQVNGTVSVGNNTQFSGILMTNGAVSGSNSNTGQMAIMSIGGNINLINAQVSPNLISPSQLLFQSPPVFVNTVLPASIGVCDTLTFQTIVTANETIDSLFIEILLPDSINYIGGTVTSDTLTITESNINNLNQPVFQLTQTLFLGDSIMVSYDVIAGCRGSAITQAVTVISQVTVDSIIEQSDSALLFTSPIVNISNTGGGILQVIFANIGDTVLREIKIKNSGDQPLTSFTIVDAHGPAIELDSISMGTLNTDTVGNSDTISLSLQDFSGAGFPTGLTTGDSIILIEYIVVNSCTDIGSSLGESAITYYQECNGIRCQEQTVFSSIIVKKQASITVTPNIITQDLCFGPQNRQEIVYTIASIGDSPALNILFNLSSTNLTHYVNSGFDLIDSNGDTTLNYFIPDSADTAFFTVCADTAINNAYFSIPVLDDSDFVRLRVFGSTCCPTACDEVHLRDFGYSFSYQNQCLDPKTSSGSQGVVSGPVKQAFLDQDFEGPTDMDNGEIALFTYTNIGMGLWPGDSSSLFQVDYTLDTGLCYVDSSLFLLGVGGNEWYPDTVLISGDNDSCRGVRTVTAFFTIAQSQGSLNFKDQFIPGEFNIRLQALCDAPPASTVLQEVSYIASGGCPDTCAIPLSCISSEVFIHCPGCARQGIHLLKYDISRINSGEPDNDNDGVADGIGSLLDSSRVKLNRAMVGDTLMGIVETEVKIIDGYAPALPLPFSLRYGYYKTSISNGENLTPLGATVRIYDCDTTGLEGNACTGLASATYIFEIPDTQVFRFLDTLFVYDFSLDTLQKYNFVPAYLDSFMNGDSVLFMPKFKVTGNVGPQIIQVYVNNHIYLSAAPDVNFNTLCDPSTCDTADFEPFVCNGDSVFSCDSNVIYYCTKYGGSFSLVGYDYSMVSIFPSKNTCSKQILYSGKFKVGPGAILGTNVFPYEYRNWGKPQTVKVPVPPGFTLDSVVFGQSRNAGTGSNVGQKLAQAALAPFTIISGPVDTAVFDFAQYFTDNPLFANSSDSLYLSDDDFGPGLAVYLSPSCATPDTAALYVTSLTADPSFDPDSLGDFSGEFLVQLGFSPPALSLSANIAEGIEREVCWNATLINTAGRSFNTWIAVDSTFGGVTITSISAPPGTPIIPVNGIYRLGDILMGQSLNIDICVEYGCDTANLIGAQFLTGWDCEYPDSLGTYPCNAADTSLLFINTFEGGMIASISATGSVNFCEAISDTITITNNFAAPVYDMVVEITVPQGVTLDTLNGRLEYFMGTFNGVGAPALSGNTYRWELNDMDTTIAENGLPGTETTSDTSQRSVRLLFDLLTDCSFVPGGDVIIQASAVDNCGDSILVVFDTLRTTPEIFDYPVATEKDLSVSVSDFSGCDSTAVVTIAITNTDSVPTGSSDYFNFILPSSCMEFDSGSFTSGANPLANGNPTVNGDTLTWLLPSGVDPAVDSLISFSFNIVLNNGFCGSGPFSFSGNTSLRDSLSCGSQFCLLEVFGGSDVDNAGIALPLFSSIAGVNVNCNGDNDGSINLSVSGGTQPYTYLWSNSETTEDLTGLSPDTYSVTISDNNDCVALDTANILEPGLLSITMTTADPTCFSTFTGAGSVAVVGGVFPYTYQWSSNSNPVGNNQSTTVDSLFAGPVGVLVMDLNGCFEDTFSVIQQPPPLTVSITDSTDVLCNALSSPLPQFNGGATAAASGGTPPYSYQWNPSGSTGSVVSNLGIGNNTVTVTDNNGCGANANVVIDEPPAVDLFPVNITDATCNDANGQIAIFGSGGTPPLRYRMSGPFQTSGVFDGLTAGNYTIQVVDTNGCDLTDNVVVGPPTLGATVQTFLASTTCVTSDGELEVVVTGGTPPYTYLWSSNASNQTSQIAIGLLFGHVYTVDVTDALGCTFNAAGILSNPIQLGFATVSTVCTGSDATGSATVTVSGFLPPFTFQWDDAQSQTGQTATGLSAGIYNVTTTDSLGCTVFGSITISNTVTSFDFVNPVITQDTTWSGSLITVKGPLVIDSGAVLTIDSTNVEFYYGPVTILGIEYDMARVEVREGSGLIVLNSTLRGGGGCIWDGVEVWGSDTFPQSDPIQAELEINNASTIENALIGVLCGRRPLDNAKVDPTSGGIIRATNSAFLNNRVGIELNSYPDHSRVSFFQDCVFNYDGNSLFTYEFIHPFENMIFIKQFDSRGLTLSDNTFTTDVSAYPDVDERGTAIKCWNSGVDVVNGGSGNTFTGLTYGVRVLQGTGSLIDIVVDDNTFTNVKQGVYIQGGSLDAIKDNTFNIPDEIDAYGVYMVSSDGFVIQGNTCTGTAGDNYGMVFENSGAGGGIAFNNNFGRTSFGVQTQGNNQSLKIRCNNFAFDSVAHGTSAWATLALNQSGTTDTLRTQGTECNPAEPEKAAGNEWKFLCPAGTDESNMVVDAAISFDYFAHLLNVVNEPFTVPDCSSPVWQGTDLISCPFIKTANSCDSYIPGVIGDPTGNLPAYIAEVRGLALATESDMADLEELVDGGETQALLNKIHNDEPAGQVKSALLLASPYLSDEVLLAAVEEKPTPLPPGHIKEVIIANSPVTDAVADAVNGRNLPPGIQNQIDNAQTGVSERSELEADIRNLAGDIQLMENEVVRWELNRDNPAGAKLVLEQSSRLASKKLLAEILLAEGNTTDSRILVSTIEQFQDTENQNYASLMNTVLDLADASQTVVDMSSAQEQTIRDVALSETVIAAEAEAILALARDEGFDHPIVKIQNQQLRLAWNGTEEEIDEPIVLDTPKRIEDTESYQLGNYPNPFNEGTIITAYVPSGFGNSKLIVRNIVGKTVARYTLKSGHNAIEVNSAELRYGTYFYSLVVDGRRIETKKMVSIR